MSVNRINPTQLNKTTMITKKMLEEQIALVESFLYEFCGVSGLEESELKEHVEVATIASDNVVMVVDSSSEKILFGVRMKVKKAESNLVGCTEVLGEYTQCMDKYPRTTEMFLSTSNGRVATFA